MKSLQEKETEFGFFLVTPETNIIPQEEARSGLLPREANSDEGIFPALAVEDLGAIHDVALATNLHNYKNSIKFRFDALQDGILEQLLQSPMPAPLLEQALVQDCSSPKHPKSIQDVD
jgi:hypothetical protein